MFVRNLAVQASLLQQMHYNSAHESWPATGFLYKIVILLL